VVAVSGGIDSSVCARSLPGPSAASGCSPCCFRARFVRESTGWRLVAEHLNLEYRVEHIGPALEAIGCYRWRDEAIRRIFLRTARAGARRSSSRHPERAHVLKLVVQSPAARRVKSAWASTNYLQVVAATNFKQRLRKTLDYFHADRLTTR